MPNDPRNRLCVVRGGGDLATGVAWRLTKAGFPTIVTELPAPLTVRRSVALSTAVADGAIDVEGMVGRLVGDAAAARATAFDGDVAVIVDEGIPAVDPAIVVDARLAKRNLDTRISDAPLVIGLGPGFDAGADCHAVIETMRGQRLGRVIWSGPAQANTGRPPAVAGKGNERVLRAPLDGTVSWTRSIGDIVGADEQIGSVGPEAVTAPFAGVIRGLIRAQTRVTKGLKIGDVDPRLDTNCNEISDKALAIGGGVVEAALSHRPNRGAQ